MEKEVAPNAAPVTTGTVVPLDSRAVPRSGKAQGLTVPRYFTTPGVDPADEIAWELPHRVHHRRGRQGRLRAEGHRGARSLVDAGHQRGGLEVLPRHARHARARELGAPAGRPRGRHHHPLGRAGRLLRHAPTDQAAFHAELTHLLLHQKVAFNSPGLVQRGRRGAPAVLGLLHQLRRGHDGVDPRRWPRPRACSSSTARAPAPTSRRSARSRELLAGGGTASGPVSLHEGLRRLRRRHQVGRQDPPRRQDGHPQRRPPRHRRVHPLQGRARRRRPGR